MCLTGSFIQLLCFIPKIFTTLEYILTSFRSSNNHWNVKNAKDIYVLFHFIQIATSCHVRKPFWSSGTKVAKQDLFVLTMLWYNMQNCYLYWFMNKIHLILLVHSATSKGLMWKHKERNVHFLGPKWNKKIDWARKLGYFYAAFL